MIKGRILRPVKVPGGPRQAPCRGTGEWRKWRNTPLVLSIFNFFNLF